MGDASARPRGDRRGGRAGVNTDPIAHAAVRGFRESAKTRLAAVLGTYGGLTLPLFADATGVAFLDEDTLLITRQETAGVRGVATETGEETVIFAPSPRLYASDVLRDGELALTAGMDGRVRLFDARNGEQASAWEIASLAVRFAGGAHFVSLTGSIVDGGAIEVRRVSGGRVVRPIESPPAFAVAASPDALAVIAGDNRRRVLRIHALDGILRLERVLPEAQARGSRFALAFSPEGTRLAFACWNLGNGEAALTEVIEISGGKTVRTFSEQGVSDLAWLPDGSGLALAGHYRAGVWDLATGARRWEYRADGFRSVAVAPSGRTLAFGMLRGTVRVLDAATGRPRVGDSPPDFSGRFTVSADGQRFVARAHHDPALVTRDGEVESRFAATMGRATTEVAGFLPDRRPLLFHRTQNAPRGLLAAASGAPWSVPAATGTFAFSADGALLAVGDGNEVSVLDAASQTERVRLRDGHAAGTQSYDLNDDLHVTDRFWVPFVATALVFSPDGTRVLSVATDGSVCLWDAATGAKLRTWMGGSGAIPAFDRDGAAAYSAGNRIVCVDARSGEPRFELALSTGCFAAASDRPLLAAGAGAREIVLLHAADGRELDRLSLESALDRPDVLAFSGDDLWCLTQRGIVLRFALT